MPYHKINLPKIKWNFNQGDVMGEYNIILFLLITILSTILRFLWSPHWQPVIQNTLFPFFYTCHTQVSIAQIIKIYHFAMCGSKID